MKVQPGSSQRAMVDPLEVTDDSFDKAVIEADKPVLLYVWSSASESCQIVGPAIIRLASREVANFQLIMADKSAIARTAEKYEISTSPMLMMFRNGQEIARCSGVMIEPEISRWLTRECR
jgi:thioredoxin